MYEFSEAYWWESKKHRCLAGMCVLNPTPLIPGSQWLKHIIYNVSQSPQMPVIRRILWKTKRFILCTKYCVHCAYTQSSPLWFNSTSCSSSVLDWSMPIKSYQIMIKKFVLTRETFSGYEICRRYIYIYWNILDNSHSLADEDQWDKLQLFISLIKFTRNGRVINISV